MSEEEHAGFGAVVTKGIGIGLVSGVVLMVLLIWMFSEQDLDGALRSGILPGVMFGTFTGGFAAVTLHALKTH